MILGAGRQTIVTEADREEAEIDVLEKASVDSDAEDQPQEALNLDSDEIVEPWSD